MYDVLQHFYIDALLQKRRNLNESSVLTTMVDRSDIENAFILADRGYESYNNLAHIQEKGWNLLVRIKNGTNGIVSGLTLPDADEFDVPFHLKVNFSAAAHICLQFFLGRVRPPDLEALLMRFTSPIRPGRKDTRKTRQKYSASFTYRVHHNSFLLNILLSGFFDPLCSHAFTPVKQRTVRFRFTVRCTPYSLV